MLGALSRLFGSSNERRLKGHKPRVAEINALESELESLAGLVVKAGAYGAAIPVVAGRNVRMRVDPYSGIDAKGHTDDSAGRPRSRGDARQLFDAFHLDRANAGGDGRIDLMVQLGHRGRHDFVGRHPCAERELSSTGWKNPAEPGSR